MIRKNIQILTNWYQKLYLWTNILVSAFFIHFNEIYYKDIAIKMLAGWDILFLNEQFHKDNRKLFRETLIHLAFKNRIELL